MRTSSLVLLLAAGAACAPAAAASASGPPLLAPSADAAQDSARWADSVRVSIDRAYLAASADGMAAAAALAERALTVRPNDALLRHYLGYARYREAAMRTGPAVRPLLDAAVRELEASARRLPLPETHALLARIYARLSGQEPTRAAELGQKADEARATAVASGERNPRVWLLLGSGAVYVPAQYGGGLDVAETSLTRALGLFAADRPAAGRPAWGEAEAHAWMGEVSRRRGKTDEARASFDRALALAPDYVWVRGTLIPALARAQR
jgi:tetratricopeptide (TPR) repeat protein